MGNDEALPSWRYDLEENDFVWRIVEMAHAVHLWDRSLNYDELVRDNPHRAYVIAIEYRLERIVDRFKSVNVVDQMLAVRQLSISNPMRPISWYQWSRIILDVCLARVTSIRDCSFLFVSEIYELGLDPRKVSLKTIKNTVHDELVIEVCERIAGAARHFRDDRDRHLHRGEESDFGIGEDAFFYKILSVRDTLSGSTGRIVKMRGAAGEERVPDVVVMHEEVVRNIQEEYHRETDTLITLVEELLIAVEPEFDRRWSTKRDSASDVRDWEKEIRPASEAQ